MNSKIFTRLCPEQRLIGEFILLNKIYEEAKPPIEDRILTLHPQITFTFYSNVLEIPLIDTHLYTEDSILLPCAKCNAEIPQIYVPLQQHKDRRLEEFLQGEKRYQNFINQDLTIYNLQ